METLSSDWTGLSDHLLAKIYPVDHKGVLISNALYEVQAPITEGSLEATYNWQSPFEGSGADSKAPTITAMVQSGAIEPILNTLREKVGDVNIDSKGVDSRTLTPDNLALNNQINDFIGKTGMTKLNSTQVFSGMPPVKINMTLLFRAFSNPQVEVMNPITQLFSWSLPQQLAKDGLFKNLLDAVGKNADAYLDALLPSKAPQMVAVTYKGETYSPMVIESLSKDFTAPVDKDGKYTRMSLPITLSTLTALDQNDLKKITASSSAN